MFKDLSEETIIVLVVIVAAFAFMAFLVLIPDWGPNAQTSAEVARLRSDVNGLRMEVNRLNDHAGLNAGLDPDAEPADLRRWSRRDAADNLYPPDDHAEFTGRRDSFDRRPSQSGEGKP